MLDALKKLMIESPLLALGVVFWIGAVASLSSCMVVRLPIVVGYVGASGDSRKRSLLLTGLFLAGLVISYILMGAAVAFIGGSVSLLLHTSKAVFWVSGALLVVVGLLISGMISPGLLPGRWQLVAARLKWTRPTGALVIGLMFGLLTMPACPLCGAGLIVLGGIAAAKSLSLYGLATFASFALGQAVPVVAVGILTTVLRPGLIRRLRTRLCSAEQHTQLLCGNLLIVLGIYYVVVG